MHAKKFALATLIGSISASMTLLKLPQSNLPRVNGDGSISRQKSSLSGGHDTCFLAAIIAENTRYLVQVDTGSTDTILPHSSLNAYYGQNISYDMPQDMLKQASSSYGDGSFWYGFPIQINIALNETTLSAMANVYLMTFQSTFPIFASGDPYQGLMGVAFDSLSQTPVPPVTVMDAWVESGIISDNHIAFHGCPYSLESSSWIDFGNETPYYGCNFNQSVSVLMPSKSYYNVDVLEIGVAGEKITLPGLFQDAGRWSFIDSCTSNIMIPRVALTNLQETITKSGAISTFWMNSGYIPQWLNAQVLIPFLEKDIKWSLLPNISFTINTNADPISPSTVTLTLGPRQYIQANKAGYYAFMVSSWADQYSILGLPFFSAYHIVVDRDNGRINFQLGCGCEFSTDGYPKISTSGYQMNGPPPAYSFPDSIQGPAPNQRDSNYKGGYSWQPKVFAPFIDTSVDFNIIKFSNTVGTARYILGFVHADDKGKPSWLGTKSISSLPHLNDIQAVRYFGGDVVISFGGPLGEELAVVSKNEKSLVNAYQNVLYGYSASWLDFYLSGNGLNNKTVVDLRNLALRTMQISDPNPRISYTLPGTPSGFSESALYVLQSAVNLGVRVDVVNILAMNFDASMINHGNAMSTLVMSAARGAYAQIKAIGLKAKVGVTIKIGKQENSALSISPADASSILKWAQTTSWIGLLSEDPSLDTSSKSGVDQKDNQFAQILVQYEN